MGLTQLAFLALLAAVAVSRLTELTVSRRHQRAMVSRGATRVVDPRFRVMVALHGAILGGAGVEVIALNRPLLVPLATAMGIVFVAAEAVRWWAIRALGQHWNVQVMNSTQLGVVTSGPFRFVRHPNYAAVFVQMTALPLIHTAWLTALIGAAVHTWVVSRRVALEESVLLTDPAYRAAMGSRPRFVPALRRSTAGLLVVMIATAGIRAEEVTVKNPEGAVHGFLVLRTLDGARLADGDLIQTVSGEVVTSRLVFHFKDGSTDDETTVFSQRGHFQLLTDHLVQKGPAFPHPVDMTIDAARGTDLVVRYAADGRAPQTDTEHVPDDAQVANGLLLTLLKNIKPDAPPRALAFLAATPKPEMVTLKIDNAGRERFMTGGLSRTATHYVVRVDVGGVKGLIAPLIGKRPPDSHVWILNDKVPAFVKSEQPLYGGGPVCRIELVTPMWRSTDAPSSQH